ncbi:hypothetical protein llap_18523 [Limosa lapponica baueri]|uniref:Protein kinase domain-containing protein n=1 Tax=Limosa lapponica baueri TaxID=1758121 RepID=A0A2I0TBJ8_LIMLA|nr:hypothetical protein llap_18523 [Limosa lapponica baueri]
MALEGTWWCLLSQALKKSLSLLSQETFKRTEKEYSVSKKSQLTATKLEPVVEKWKKWHSVPFLGIPSCLGFGLHADSYRFLVFSDLGRTLQSVLNDGLYLLREKAAFQIVVRLLDCLEYIHENEYVHGDITAENIYLNPADLTQRYLQQVMALEYEEKPHYEGLRQLFKKPLEKMKSSAYDPVDIKMVP